MKDYAQATGREKLDQVLIYVRTSYLSTRGQPDVLSEDINYLTLKLKTHSCHVSVSNIVARNDQYRKKALAVNRKPNDLCKVKKAVLYKS